MTPTGTCRSLASHLVTFESAIVTESSLDRASRCLPLQAIGYEQN
ncbi:hypothetical protein [Leptolyngbya sp. FACHB-321]|nr:hypothetical protein [Leptolyngbya sp. FACHB-321]